MPITGFRRRSPWARAWQWCRKSLTAWSRWWSSRLRLGNQGERAAASFLQRLGYRIVARQHRNWAGEIDLIAEGKDGFVFVEVKTRAATSVEPAIEAVDRQKQRRICRAAMVWLKQRRLINARCRFDVIVVLVPDRQQPPIITHYQHAFDAPTDLG